jgi:protein SCO1/2
MSFRKKIFGVIVILITFSSLFLILIPKIYSNNPAGRFSTNIETKFNFLEKETKPLVMIFFGYVNCPDICVPSLSELSKIYNKIKQKNKISIYFVNLQATAHPESVKEYAKVFNKDFKGIYLDYATMLEVVSKLNVIYKATPNSTTIDHSGYIHLLVKHNNEFIQKYVYTARPYDIEYISSDINKMIERK